MSEENPILADFTPEGLAVVTLNRPERHNAFNADIIARLATIFEEIAKEDALRAMILRAEGPSFSAGADLDWMRAAADYTYDDNLDDARALADMLRRLNELPLPTIALVQGPAYGGGVGLVSACDVAVAVEGASFAFSEVRLGIVPATISPYVIDAIGPRAARRYFLTGERFDAAEAKRIGLVHEVVSDVAALGHASDRLVEAIWQGAPGAIAAAKDLIFAVAHEPIDEETIEETAERIAERRATDEAKEGLEAFLAKRKPAWRD
jgi:methylglutaconyl-CoA hydratase